MPEPDLSVVRGEIDDYEDVDPGPEDLALVVEVSDTTVLADRAMAATYIGGGIPLYWLVNVRDRQLEVYTPSTGASPQSFWPRTRRPNWPSPARPSAASPWRTCSLAPRQSRGKMTSDDEVVGWQPHSGKPSVHGLRSGRRSLMGGQGPVRHP